MYFKKIFINLYVFFCNMKELLKTIILDFQARLPLSIIERDATLPINSGKIISVCGVRRCGKTYVLFDTMNRLLAANVPKENILFLSFDDERLTLEAGTLDMILQAYRELYPNTQLSNVYMFFDEVQMANNWEQFIRRVYDTETKNLFVSGSNSKLLATEIATSLRGRTLQFEIFPLSFAEYCRFRKIDTDVYNFTNEARIRVAFTEFNTKGGFPELALCGFQNFEHTLQEYYHIMLYKDLVERYNVSNIPVLKYFVSRLLSSLSKPVSVNKIYNEIKSAGLKVDRNYLYELAEHLQAIYFIQRLGKYDPSVLKTELSNEKKVYLIDNGLASALNYTLQNDYGKLFENTSFLWLRRQTAFQRGLYFYKGLKECDFVLLDRDKPSHLFQICWDLKDPDTLKREIRGLEDAAEYLKCKSVFIITPETEKIIKTDKLEIQVKAAWKYFLHSLQ